MTGRLEAIVSRLQEGNIPLEEMIKLYEEGSDEEVHFVLVLYRL